MAKAKAKAIDDLAEAAAVAAERGDWAGASASLEGAWQATRLPRLGELIALLDGKRAPTPVAGKTVTAREQAWLAAALDPDPAVEPSLCATPWPTRPRDAIARVEVLAQRAPSPRISQLVLGLHARNQYPSAAGRKLARAIFRMLFAQADPAVTEHLAALERDDSVADRAARDALLTLARRARPPVPTASARATAALARVAATVATTPVAATRHAHDELLAAVYAAPFDDAPREVLADLLVERGDPRGELIALQLRRARGDSTAASLARERALLRAAGNTWYGGLDDDGATRIELARGFPVRAHMEYLTFASPAWATIEHLVISPGQRFSLANCPTLHAVRILQNVPSTALGGIELPHPEQLEELVVFGTAKLDARTALAPRRLGLERVAMPELDTWIGKLGKLATWPVGRRVEELQLSLSISGLARAVRALAAAPRLTAVEVMGVEARAWERLPQHWSARLARDELAFTWTGEGNAGRDFEELGLVLRDLEALPKVARVVVRAHGKLARVHLPRTLRAIRPIVHAWPGAPKLEVEPDARAT